MSRAAESLVDRLLDRPRTELSTPAYPWERHPNPGPVYVNESPEPIIHHSTISVTYSASGCSTPYYSLGLVSAHLHANLMKLVEVVPTLLTDEDITEGARKLCEQLGKVPVVAKDRAGFIVNALLFPYLNHAARMFEAGYASREDIDAAMMNGCGHPMGPLQLLDLVGLDTSLAIIEALYAEFHDPNYAPVPLLRRMVSAERLGRKTGHGFYDYG